MLVVLVVPCVLDASHVLLCLVCMLCLMCGVFAVPGRALVWLAYIRSVPAVPGMLVVPGVFALSESPACLTP